MKRRTALGNGAALLGTVLAGCATRAEPSADDAPADGGYDMLYTVLDVEPSFELLEYGERFEERNEIYDRLFVHGRLHNTGSSRRGAMVTVRAFVEDGDRAFSTSQWHRALEPDHACSFDIRVYADPTDVVSYELRVEATDRDERPSPASNCVRVDERLQ